MDLTLRALSDFRVGPNREIAIKYGSIHKVCVLENGTFSTKTDDGRFFGWCNLSDERWEIVDDEANSGDGV
jgi:hypothetical protein